MHFVFMPYGKRIEVETLLRDMEAEKHMMSCWKGKRNRKDVWINGGIRTLPFGIHEYVFPKESMDRVLTTLLPQIDRYDTGWIRKTILRKLVRVDKLPPFKKDQGYRWLKNYVNIIPIGIRHDNTALQRHGPLKGWTHETI